MTQTMRQMTMGAAAAVVLFCLSCIASSAYATPAFAANIQELTFDYQVASSNYENALLEQQKNEDDIVVVQYDIHAAEREILRNEDALGDAVVELYKDERHREDLIAMLLDSNSLDEALFRYDSYMRVENHYSEQIRSAKQKKDDLVKKKVELENKRVELQAKVDETQQAAEAAEAALRDADHSDGAEYQQTQGNGSNCGATAFIVCVNTLLHENKFTDNVKVWSGAGFEGDSTTNLAMKGQAWLAANDLSDTIGIETVPGDIRSTAQLQAVLEQGNVVVISSGAGSVWQRADGSKAGPGEYPDGHWIMFYQYEGGVFFANDSAVSKKLGAGVPYTEEQMQQWLDGRSTHFAVVLYKK